MAKMLSDENHKVTFVPALSDYHAPTTAELNAGLDVQCLVSMNNFVFGVTGVNTIDDPALCSGSNDQAPGKKTYEVAMDFYRFDTPEADVAYNTFTDSGIQGYFVRRIGKNHEAPFVAGDVVEAVQVVSGPPMPQTPSGGFEKFRVQYFPQGGGTDDRAVVV